jgi:hypothetical protein
MGAPRGPKVHHYVPESLLRHWGTGKKDQVHVFDKATQRTWASKAKNLARESGFYEFEVGGEKLSLEEGLQMYEAAVGHAFKVLRRTEDLTQLREADPDAIACFLALQFTRTPGFREMMRNTMGAIRDRFSRDEISDELAKDLAQGAQDQSIRLMAARMVANSPQDFGPHFLAKTWVLARPPAGRSFLLGDNPVVLQNQTFSHPWRGNLGLAVRGIEIYCPLSPRLIFAAFCPSHLQWALEQREQARASAEPLNVNPNQLLAPQLRGFIEAAESGRPYVFTAENVENVNSLQVLYAERHVFSDDADFGFAIDVVTKSGAESRMRSQMA